MIPTFSRRQALALGACAISVPMVGAVPALAKNDAEAAIKKFTGGKTPRKARSSSTCPRSPRTATPCR